MLVSPIAKLALNYPYASSDHGCHCKAGPIRRGKVEWHESSLSHHRALVPRLQGRKEGRRTGVDVHQRPVEHGHRTRVRRGKTIVGRSRENDVTNDWLLCPAAPRIRRLFAKQGFCDRNRGFTDMMFGARVRRDRVHKLSIRSVDYQSVIA
jgi:hypothetical protein